MSTKPKRVALTIRVRLNAGSHITSKLLGVTASSAEGAQTAAARLGLKALGASFVSAEKVRAAGDDWQLNAEQHAAWCWPSGLIEIGPEAPAETVIFATGFDRPLREVLDIVARHGKGKGAGQLLVPGIPEADSDHEKLAALTVWIDWCAKRNGSPRALGVVFTRSHADALVAEHA